MGTAHDGYTAPASASAPCLVAADEADTTYDRVQVVAIRDGELSAIFVNKTWNMSTAFTIRYERPAL